MSHALDQLTGHDPADTAWMGRGLCVGADPETWFPLDARHSPEAVAVCNRCPVRAECLAYAVETGQEYGVWGGKTEAELREMRLSKRPECGTVAGARWHRKHKQKTCDECRAADAEDHRKRHAERRAELAATPKKDPTRREKCGTPSGEASHRYYGERVCLDCRDARNAATRERARAKKNGA